MNRTFTKLLSLTLTFTMLISTIPVAFAGNGMVGTDAVLNHEANELDRGRLLSMLDSEQVVAAIARHGVSMDEARARIAAMSDAEIQLLNERIDELPAGGNNALGILFTVFIILLVTDLLGLTNVFPFTRN